MVMTSFKRFSRVPRVIAVAKELWQIKLHAHFEKAPIATLAVVASLHSTSFFDVNSPIKSESLFEKKTTHAKVNNYVQQHKGGGIV